MAEWASALRRRLGTGAPVALVSILATEGSAPRGAGTRMIVTDEAIEGTIGGGALEHEVTRQARALLGEQAGSWRVQDYPLGPLLGQCCGGRVRLLVEHVAADGADWLTALEPGCTLRSRLEAGSISREIVTEPPVPMGARGERPGVGALLNERIGPPLRPVYLFGAGHVGQAIARALAGLPFSLAWFDTRAEMDAPGVTVLDEAELGACVTEAGSDATILILTHDHGLDYALTLAALNGPARYVGLIGSKTKRARFLARLAKDGVYDADIARLHCPIGLPGLTGKAPAEIAIAVAAQLLALECAA